MRASIRRRSAGGRGTHPLHRQMIQVFSSRNKHIDRFIEMHQRPARELTVGFVHCYDAEGELAIRHELEREGKEVMGRTAAESV